MILVRLFMGWHIEPTPEIGKKKYLSLKWRERKAFQRFSTLRTSSFYSRAQRQEREARKEAACTHLCMREAVPAKAAAEDRAGESREVCGNPTHEHSTPSTKEQEQTPAFFQDLNKFSAPSFGLASKKDLNKTTTLIHRYIYKHPCCVTLLPATK